MTSSADASWGPTTPRLLAPGFGTERQVRVPEMSSARQALAFDGFPRLVAVARPLPHSGAACAGAAANRSTTTHAQKGASRTTIRSRVRKRALSQTSAGSPN